MLLRRRRNNAKATKAAARKAIVVANVPVEETPEKRFHCDEGWRGNDNGYCETAASAAAEISVARRKMRQTLLLLLQRPQLLHIRQQQ